jgi:hypothetical protein
MGPELATLALPSGHDSAFGPGDEGDGKGLITPLSLPSFLLLSALEPEPLHPVAKDAMAKTNVSDWMGDIFPLPKVFRV